MDFIRIGEKLIDKVKVFKIVETILELRQKGLSQQDVARELRIDRTFVSRLESLGEVRKGGRVALVGFPVRNKDELAKVAAEEGVDFVLLLTDKERWDFVEQRNGTTLFNEIMQIIKDLREFDAVIFIGSDMRVGIVRSVLGDKVIGIEVGESPIKEDKHVDPDEIRGIIRHLKNRG